MEHTDRPEHCNRNRGSSRRATAIDDADSACGDPLKRLCRMKVDQSEPRPRSDRGTVSGSR